MKVIENGKWVYKPGGIITGPTLSLSKKNKNPEIIYPLEKLKKHINNG